MEKEICVLRLTPYFYFENEAPSILDLDYEPLGGMQVQITEQTKSISKLCKLQVVLTTGLPKIPRHYQISSNTQIVSVRLPTPAFKSKSKGRILLLPSWALGTILWSIKHKLSKKTDFDVIHHHTSDLLGSFISGPIVSWILGLPLIITVHCSPTFTFAPHTFTEKLFFRLSKTIEQWAVRKANCVYLLTERTYEMYKKSGIIPESKMKVISDGVNTELFCRVGKERTTKLKKEFNIPTNKKVVSYIGRIAPEKGWKTFVQMAKLLEREDIHFLICGDGYTRKDFEQELDIFQLKDRFTFTGYIEHKRIVEALNISDCLILPSYHEEFGGVLLEAMACETPIVASNVGGIPYIITDNQTGYLVSPNDHHGFAERLSFVLDNEDKTRQVVKKARDTVVRRFSIQAVADKIFTGYKVVVNSI